MSKVYSVFPAKPLLFIRACKMRSQISSSSAFSELLRKWTEKSYDKHMSLNAQNIILQIIAIKMLHGIASDIAESGYYSVMAGDITDVSNIETACNLHSLGGQGDDSMWGIYWSDASCPDKCRQLLFASKMCCCIWISEFTMLVGSAVVDVRPWLEPKMGLLHKSNQETEWKMFAGALLLPLRGNIPFVPEICTFFVPVITFFFFLLYK